jgi:glycosyltransferase involved in cell wall biosynthesis
MSRITVVLPCHNQDTIVNFCIKKLYTQSVSGIHVLVVDDHSKSFNLTSKASGSVVEVKSIDAKVKGRSSTRNLGIRTALEDGADVVIFMDGDTFPESDDFVENHLSSLGGHPYNKSRLVFGMRKHTKECAGGPEEWESSKDSKFKIHITYPKYPSDLLTGNMDNLAEGNELDYRDLRILSGVTDKFNTIKDFDEKADYLLTGMVAWSCNFSITKKALNDIKGIMDKVYDLDGWFDDKAFNTGWGYEDVALGMDAHFAGVDIRTNVDSDIIHFMHGRSDGLFTHLEGKHKIMERYRMLRDSNLDADKETFRGSGTYLCHDQYKIFLKEDCVIINGRLFNIPIFVRSDKQTIIRRGKKLYINGYRLYHTTGDFKYSVFGKIAHWMEPS